MISLAFGGTVSAQEYPTRTIRIVVPFPAGGSLDVVARLIGDRLAQEWSHPVIIENRPGVNGTLGAETVAKSPADGYTLLFTTSPLLTTNKLLYHDIAYDPERDFKPVSLVAIAPNVLGVSPALPIKDVPGLIAYAKANPGLLTYASQGNGSTGHLSGASFNLMAGTDIRHVPYRGAAPAWSDVLAGHVSMMWDGIPSVLGQIRGGAVRALAVGSLERSLALPDVPTAREAGLQDFESVSWFAVSVVSGTSDAVVSKLSDAISRALRTPEIAARVVAIGAIPVGSTPAGLAAAIVDTTTRWKKVIDAANIRIE